MGIHRARHLLERLDQFAFVNVNVLARQTMSLAEVENSAHAPVIGARAHIVLGIVRRRLKGPRKSGLSEGVQRVMFLSELARKL